MVGRDGIRWPWTYWSNSEDTSGSWKRNSHSTGSSSGTIVSTAYTYSSRGSRLSSASSVPGIYWEWEMDIRKKAKQEEQMKYIKSLVHEFFSTRSANPSVNVGDMGVLERWLTELDVGWVLHLTVTDGASAGMLGHAFDVGSWIRALAEIMETIGFTTSLFPDRGSGSVGMPIISEEDEHADADAVPDQLQFALFFQEAIWKLLAFVDFIVCEQVLVSNGSEASYLGKLVFLLGVHGALSKALPQIRLSSYSPPSAEVERIHGSMVSLFAAKEAKACEAAWSKMEEIRTRILERIEDGDDGDSSGSVPLPWPASDIHKATQTVISYIGFLRTNYSTAAPVVSEAAALGKYVPQIGVGDIPPLDSMIIEMASCLEEKLASVSESFSDQGLRFLFLLDNSYYLWQNVQPIWSVMEFNVNAIDHKFLSFTKTHMAIVTRKVEGYMESYLQASWAPMLFSSSNSTPSHFGRSNSAVSDKFKSEFQKTYTTQKFWKVPDPGLRKTLRKAIVNKLMSSYTKSVLPELEEMLQELFEG